MLNLTPTLADSIKVMDPGTPCKLVAFLPLWVHLCPFLPRVQTAPAPHPELARQTGSICTLSSLSDVVFEKRAGMGPLGRMPDCRGRAPPPRSNSAP